MMMAPDTFIQQFHQQISRTMMSFLNQPTLENEKTTEKALKQVIKEFRDTAKREQLEGVFKERGLSEVARMISRETEIIWTGHVEGEFRGARGNRPGKDVYRQYLQECEGCCRMMEFAADLYEDKYAVDRERTLGALQRMAQACLDSHGYDVKKPLFGKETRNEIPLPADVQKTMLKRVDACAKQREAIEKHTTGFAGVLHNALRSTTNSRQVEKKLVSSPKKPIIPKLGRPMEAPQPKPGQPLHPTGNLSKKNTE